ncbi:hypothetical protein V8E53_002609 [Lactarius tabidus]
MRNQYPPEETSAAEVPISSPCIIVDMQGIILAWYLPGILKSSQQSEMMAAMEKLHPLLHQHQSGAHWHGDPELFPLGTEGPHGVLNISPAWFQQGHKVTCFSL